MNVALIGAPASGKATLAPELAARFDLIRISQDGLLRDSLARSSTLGLLARQCIERGELIPDEVLDAMLEEHLRAAPAERGLLFESFPRTSSQASHLDELLPALGRSLDVVLRLTVTEQTVLGRLQGRIVCRECHASFHREHRPFRSCPEGRCSGEHLYRRDDDQPQLAATRLRIFRRASAPLVERYQQAGKLVIVDANGSVESVLADAVRVLEGFRDEQRKPAVPLEELDRVRSLSRGVAPLSEAEVSRATLDFAFLGGPGSGKGTQAERLARSLGVPHVATGDLFRQNLQRETALGRLARAYMDRGELVPDEITERMVRERLEQPDAASGFVLDGFPRTLPQAQALTEMLTEAGRRLSAVIHLAVDDEMIVSRLSQRLVCRECQRPFHALYNPFTRCPEDRCRGEHLYRRDDDAPATIRSRLRTYHAETAPLVGYYRAAGLIVDIAADASVDEVAARIAAAVRPRRRQT